MAVPYFAWMSDACFPAMNLTNSRASSGCGVLAYTTLPSPWMMLARRRPLASGATSTLARNSRSAQKVGAL